MRVILLTLFLGATLVSTSNAQERAPFYTDRSRLLYYLDNGGKEHAVTTPAEWRIRRAHILANMQSVMGPLPEENRKVPLDVEIVDEVRLEKTTRRKIRFSAEKGDRAWAYLMIPHDPEGKAPAMLCLHPTTPIGKGMTVGLGGKPNRSYALELARRGYVTIAPDYPNYGDYRFDPYANGYISATMKGIWNHMRAVDVLQSMKEVDGDRIGCIGHSLGGHNTMFVSVFDTRIKVMVSSCGFNSFFKYMGGDLSGWSHSGYMPLIKKAFSADPKRMPFDFTEVAGALAPRPFFVNAPTGDSNFEVSGVKDCVKAAEPVYELLGGKGNLKVLHPDCGHDFPPEVREAAYEFVDKALKR